MAGFHFADFSMCTSGKCENQLKVTEEITLNKPIVIIIAV